jgi:hypothetical protein
VLTHPPQENPWIVPTDVPAFFIQMPKQAPYAPVPAVIQVVGKLFQAFEPLRENRLYLDAEPGTGSAGVCRFVYHRAVPS